MGYAAATSFLLPDKGPMVICVGHKETLDALLGELPGDRDFMLWPDKITPMR